MPLVRLDAEAIYDSYLQVAGRLDERRFGPADTVEVRGDGLVTPKGSAAGWRRLVYVQQKRKQIPTHLDNFDYPQMNPNCLERRDSTVAPQALYLMNNGMVQDLAEQFARRVIREAGGDAGKQIEQAYWLALSRAPNDEERRIGLESLAVFEEKWLSQPTGSNKQADRQKALTTYCHAILNSASFLYVD
jgi:hypothetical protein